MAEGSVREFVKSGTARVLGVSPVRTPEMVDAVKAARVKSDNEVAIPFATGHPVEGTKAYMRNRPGRSIALISAAAIAVSSVAVEAGAIGFAERFAGALADKVFPERLEPTNYCRDGGILSWHYEKDWESSPGDCDYNLLLERQAGSAAATGASGAPTQTGDKGASVPPAVSIAPAAAAPSESVAPAEASADAGTQPVAASVSGTVIDLAGVYPYGLERQCGLLPKGGFPQDAAGTITPEGMAQFEVAWDSLQLANPNVALPDPGYSAGRLDAFVQVVCP